MTRNPLINALAASLYIVLIASVLYWGTHAVEPRDSILVPVIMLSLFVLSAAMMGYIFLLPSEATCLPVGREKRKRLIQQNDLLGSFSFPSKRRHQRVNTLYISPPCCILKKKEKALKLFWATVGIFACITLVLAVTLFLIPPGA